MAVEKIYTGIYLTNSKHFRTPDKYLCLGFTHTIYIDKHIYEANNDPHTGNKIPISLPEALTIPNKKSNDHSCNECTIGQSRKSIDNTVKALELNFGEASHLMTVLPSCYKSVQFIDGALKHHGTILVIDPSGNQKCITIVLGYLMYTYNIRSQKAFDMLQKIHPNIKLDEYFLRQLYEYEPILQMQRIQSKGHSCSREFRSAILKRKKNRTFYDSDTTSTPLICNYYPMVTNHHQSSHTFFYLADSCDTLME